MMRDLWFSFLIILKEKAAQEQCSRFHAPFLRTVYWGLLRIVSSQRHNAYANAIPAHEVAADEMN